MKTLLEELNAPRPVQLPDWNGVNKPFEYPWGGVTIARTGTVFLVKKHVGFCVLYCLDKYNFKTIEDASNKFADCILHQAKEAGLI